MQVGSGALRISDSVQFQKPTNLHGLNATIVDVAIDDTRKSIFTESFVPWKFYERGSDFAPSSNLQSINKIELAIQQSNATKEGAYFLSVSSNGQVKITASTAIGLRYGLNTFSQLFYKDYYGALYMNKAPVTIVDAPKFEHRGLMLDVARTWYPISFIEKTIDGLAFNKMNKLHLHATDSQSWPLEIPSLPEISARGRYCPTCEYTAADFEQIQEYAMQRGVDLLLEIDMPSHIASLVYSHASVIGGWNMYPYYNAAAEPPSGVLNIDEKAATSLIHAILEDVLPRVQSKYYHSGGDEVQLQAFLYDPTLKSSSLDVIKPIMQKFITAVHQQVRSHGKTPFMWHDGLTDFNLTIGKDVIVQSWDKNSVSLVAALANGNRAIVSPGQEWGAWVEYPASQVSPSSTFLDYCSPKKSWRYMYMYDPLESTTSENEHLVIGGESAQWTELTDAATAEGSIWPRTSVVGEVLWSGNRVNGQLRDLTTVSPRLAEMRERLVAMGINAEALHMPFCTQDNKQCLV
ncbi:Hypothetical protein R9X50_00559500 [Acrodontium crateriforme]|uniref:Beta-hexosaminidase n=1 Tax=Acrodontium crateriforme TaxID=150365 RepID=A0AAQ3M6F9_9PEZI|nr:Hypothetical protein R9X50_00559500 [Acrodontium crateriforme]